MTSEVNISTAINQQQKTTLTDQKLAQDFDQFLSLLTTQLQNQDPLNPMDSTEFTNQIVQFSQVEQQINTNQKLDSLVQLQLSNAFGASLGYVGMDVKYVSGEFNYDGENPVELTYALDTSAISARIHIVDESGATVYSQEVERDSGAHDFVWDGTTTGGAPLPEGTYQVRIDAFDIEDEEINVSTVVKGNVSGVETQGGAIYLIVGERAVPLSNIINAQLPEEEVAITEEDPPAEEGEGGTG